jgi:YjbE family integral membrane protein
MEYLNSLNDISLISVAQIILIDILLGGDNAIVIALACRNLSGHLRLRGIALGTLGAILARAILLIFASVLLELSYVKLLSGLLLYWIAVKLLLEPGDEDNEIDASYRLWQVVRTIIMADIIMSIDNVVAIAGAAQQSGSTHPMSLMILGIIISIPIIVAGSTLVIAMMERFPVIVVAGSAMLAYIAATLTCSDSVVVALMKQHYSYLDVIIPLVNVKLSIIGIMSAISMVIIMKSGKKNTKKNVKK